MKLAVCMAYYENAGMLERHIDSWLALPIEMRAAIQFVICDDGSQKAPARLGGPPPLHIQLFRIAVDVRWNQDAARNICVKESSAPWLLLTDIDHFIPQTTFAMILARLPALDSRTAYRFDRCTAASAADLSHGESYKPHPNSWLMHRTLWQRIGGYDERLAGYYGTDADFRDSVCMYAKQTAFLHGAPLMRVPRELIPDASTTNYGRKEPQDKTLGKLLRLRYSNDPKWRPITGRFPYEKVAEWRL